MDRSTHLFQLQIPMLFLQGTRDELAELPLVTSLVEQLGERAALTQLADADHSFHVPKRAGRTEGQVRKEMLDAVAAWAGSVIERR